uniref:Dynein heavy chain n=1 Tax=Phaeomonas parva TaxID=124430 RepID=A0A7S1U3J4_9STRA
MEALRAVVNEKLALYNEENPGKRMNLVLFDDALRHLFRLVRCMGMPRGNVLCVGVGGSGKQSLSRLAAHISGHHPFQIALSKAYNTASLLDDLRILYKLCGQQGKPCTFLFTEAEIKDDTFLEIINSILMTGEVSGLFPKDELQILAADLRGFAVKERENFVDTPENLVKFFFERVRANLHLVLCMSPVSSKFAERCRKFPGIVSGCQIDWFLTWPEEALVAVSSQTIDDMTLDCTDGVRVEIKKHMAAVHRLATEACTEYFQKMRRHVYQTPKSFMSFLQEYKGMYQKKVDAIDAKAHSVQVGLGKLQQGAEDVEAMKVVLAEEEVKLRRAEEATNAMLGRLEVSSMDAKKEAEAVAKIKEACEEDARRISGEKADAEADLAQAQPFVDEAESALGKIKPNDLNELKKLQKPSDVIRLIFDCVGLLMMAPMPKVESADVTLGIGKEKETFAFIKDNYAAMKSGLLADARFLQHIMAFSMHKKDLINDETVELMKPYLQLQGFNPAVARNASKAAEGLCIWSRAMTMYHEASKIVKPKLEALRLAEARLQEAQQELYKAEEKLQACQNVLSRLQAEFEDSMAQKRQIEENAKETKNRMEQATSLIDGLAGERKRWTDDSHKFADIKRRLVGDVALACAFVSYCGPFNQDFRDYMVKIRFMRDLRDREIPVSTGLDLTAFLVDVGTIGDWGLEGLPSDPLSIQNGILVSRSSRYPLLIDPQGQALKWILNHEAANLPNFGTTSIDNPRLRDQLEYCMSEGKALIIANIEEELDPMLTPVLEKQIITRAKSKYIAIADKLCEYDDNFSLYLTTRLPNPHYTPEEQAKTTVVDFTVTQKGLEEQLLGRVIRKEQRSLEEQLTSVLEEVTENTKSLLMLDELLLQRLSANQGNLLDDAELISVLADTKAKVVEVNEKLTSASEMRESINEKREQFRPVATRGSVLYFSIVDMSLINCMYQTSLDQFQALFDKSMDVAEKGFINKRVGNIVDAMTYLVYRYINQGLYERDKIAFKLIVAMKIYVTAERLSGADVALLLKAGASLDISTAKPKPFTWMSDTAWLNTLALSEGNALFRSLPEDMSRNETLWFEWYNSNEPENLAVPNYETRFGDDAIGAFYRTTLVRCLREDRTLLAAIKFIRQAEAVEVAGGQKLPAMGPKFVEPITDTVEGVYAEMDNQTPVIYLLSAGADPTDSIETLCRKKRKEISAVSLGEGQEPIANRAISAAVVNGGWVLLQNCHLGLEFMDTMEDLLEKIKENLHADFRLFLTTEPHPKFPIALLQSCTKVTNEPPKGLRAGMLRSYTVIVDQDRLERIETDEWKKLLYALCFTHSIVQERRKFGPLGWCIPYEFNDGDLQACINFLEKHLYTGALSWPTLQYMVAQAQYGGKITDNFDRRLFQTYAEAWLTPATLSQQFEFNPEETVAGASFDHRYDIISSGELEDYHASISRLPEVDSPEVFGLHPNADLTFRVKEASELLAVIVETQPKSRAAGDGPTREEIVQEKTEGLLEAVPVDYIEDLTLEIIDGQGGLGVPLNIFLFQETQRLQIVIDIVRKTLQLVQQAIKGEVVVTEDLIRSINAIFDAAVPHVWLYTRGGDELSWLSPTLGLWYNGLAQRDVQLREWLDGGRPHSYWMTGFFNPQGFLTGMQQEVTRANAAAKWSLDSITLFSEVTDMETKENVRSAPKEGVFVHGLYLDGAAWNRSDATLVESEPKKLFAALPVLYITAVAKGSAKLTTVDYGPFGGYVAPIYKYKKRLDKYLITSVKLPTREHRPSHWTLRGLGLLASTE